jgi:hypothetical protein
MSVVYIWSLHYSFLKLTCHFHRDNLIYLPPYSPDFNSTEQAFHSIKAWLWHHEAQDDPGSFIMLLSQSWWKTQRVGLWTAGIHNIRVVLESTRLMNFYWLLIDCLSAEYSKYVIAFVPLIYLSTYFKFSVHFVASSHLKYVWITHSKCRSVIHLEQLEGFACDTYFPWPCILNDVLLVQWMDDTGCHTHSLQILIILAALSAIENCWSWTRFWDIWELVSLAMPQHKHI